MSQASAGTRAVQYLRMSTDRQAVSLVNQTATIAAFALEAGYEIVGTYADEGLSGLTLKRRPALQRLLSEVVGGTAEFSAILVYDVSRWGRFQDPDEAAHYEFVCRAAGKKLHYCAEPFENDKGLQGALLKSLKRIMSAEFSRELAVKIRAGQARHFERGHWATGAPAFGLRRHIVGRGGDLIRLERGESKALRQQRIVLAPGPAEEVAVVRRVFELYVVKRLSMAGVARQLNAEGVVSGPRGGPWCAGRIAHMLANEAYIGHAVYGRISTDSVGGRRLRSPPSAWTRAEGAFEGIIAPAMFAAAAARRPRERIASRERQLQIMTEFLQREGRISLKLIGRRRDLPSPPAVRAAFGSLSAAYEALGYSPSAGGRSRCIEGFEERAEALLAEREGAGVPVSLTTIWRQLRREGYPGTRESFRSYVSSGRRRGRRPLVDWKAVSDEELLARLSRLYDANGRLTRQLINADLNLPCAAHLAARFGGTMALYARVGFAPAPGGPAARAASRALKRPPQVE